MLTEKWMDLIWIYKDSNQGYIRIISVLKFCRGWQLTAVNAQVLLQVMFVFEGLGAFCTLKLSVSAQLRNSPLRKETGKRLFLQSSLSQHVTVNKSSVSFPLQRCEHLEGVSAACTCSRTCLCAVM